MTAQWLGNWPRKTTSRRASYDSGSRPGAPFVSQTLNRGLLSDPASAASTGGAVHGVDLLRQHLSCGPLLPVPACAEEVLGRSVTGKTATRWALGQRAGLALPVVRGVRRQLLTTVLAFRAWLEAASQATGRKGAACNHAKAAECQAVAS